MALDTADVLRDLAWSVHRRGLAPPAQPGEQQEVRGLQVSELAVFTQIRERPGLTVGELAERLRLRQPNASATVTRLVERGLVRREQSPTDGRVTLLHPTAAATAEHEAIGQVWSGPVREALSRLPGEQIAAIEAAASALEALTKELSAPPAD